LLTCRPDPSYLDPVTCGMDIQPFRYTVTVVPEPDVAWLLACGLTGLAAVRRWRNRSR